MGSTEKSAKFGSNANCGKDVDAQEDLNKPAENQLHSQDKVSINEIVNVFTYSVEFWKKNYSLFLIYIFKNSNI